MHLNVYLKGNAGVVHSSKERLKPFNVLLLCLRCNGLQNTLMTAKTDNDAHHVKLHYMLFVKSIHEYYIYP